MCIASHADRDDAEPARRHPDRRERNLKTLRQRVIAID
jgi:hypothetical protein